MTSEDTLVQRDKNVRRIKGELHEEGVEEIEIIDDDAISDVDDIDDLDEFEVFDPEEKN